MWGDKMKKVIAAAISVFIAVIIICTAFNETINSALANMLYKEKISVYSPTNKAYTVTLKKNDYIYFGKYNGKNILWKVISVDENGSPLLMSERAICFMPFNSNKTVTAGSSDWKNSSIRQWLNSSETKKFEFFCNPENKITNDSITVNGGFLCTDNFSAEELSALKEDNDKVFLPTTEMLSEMTPQARKKSPTADAVINTSSAFLQIRHNCWYWTQTPIATNTSSVTAVTSSGSYYKSLANDGLTGVCPAVYFDGAEISVCGGNGTVKLPYIFEAEGIINE